MPDNPGSFSTVTGGAGQAKGRALIDKMVGQGAPPPGPAHAPSTSGYTPPRVQPRSNMESWMYTTISKRQLGYQPTYWQDPNIVARWHTVMESGQPLPPGIDPLQVTQAYDWFKWRNNNKHWTEWRYLPTEDPALNFLAGMPMPDESFVMPHEQVWYGGRNQPAPAGPVNPQAPDFDWQSLTIEQKRDVLADPKFSIANVTAPGQQGLILSDPAFDFWGKAGFGQEGPYPGLTPGQGRRETELPWWQPIAYTMLSNPATAPLTQGLAIGVMTKNPWLGGGVAALGYGAQSENETLREVSTAIGNVLMAGAQTVEQGFGLAEYLSTPGSTARNLVDLLNWQPGKSWSEMMALSPEERLSKRYTEQLAVQEHIKQFTENPRQVWDAMKVFYETRAGEEVWILGEGEKLPVQPGYTLADAARRSIEGESPEEILLDYQRAYGFSGVASDFLMQATYDPLNVAGHAAGEARGLLHERVARVIESGPQPLTIRDTARVQIETLKAQAYRSTEGIVGMMTPFNEPSKAFRDLVRTQLPPERVRFLTDMERWMTGLTPEGGIAELQPTKPGAWNFFRNLLPDAKALVSAHIAKENVGLLLNWAGADEASPRAMFDVIEAAARGDMQTVRDMGAAFMDNPEFYTILGGVRDFLPKMREQTVAFEIARPNRDVFWRVQEVLQDPPQQLLKNFLDGDPAPDFARLVKLGGPELINEIAGLLHLDPKEVTAARVADLFKVFEAGKVPIHAQEYKAQILASFYEHMGKWGADYFGVKNESQFFEVLRGLKGAQSLMLLDFSPSYLINNFLNNRVLMAVQGVVGLTTEANMTKWMDRFGVDIPRFKEGLGPTELRAEGPLAAEAVIQQAKRGEGLGTKFADTVGAVRQRVSVASKASSRVERNASMQMYYSTMKSYYGRAWRAGVGFDRMPAILEQRLRDLGMDPEVVYRNIEGFVSPEDLATLNQGASSHTVHALIGDVAAGLGKKPEDIADMLGRLGVLDELTDSIAAAKTPDQLRRAFETVERKAMSSLDIRMSQEVRQRAEHVRNKIRAEGPAGAIEIFQDLVLDNLERKVDNDRIWDDAYAKADEAGDNWGAIHQALGQAARENRAAWRRTQSYEAAAMKGVVEGLGLDGEFQRQFLSRVTQQHDLLGTFFDEKNAAYERHYKTTFETPEAKQAARVALDFEFNEKFARAQREVLLLQQQLDDLFAGEFGRAFGGDLVASDGQMRPAAEAMARDWRRSIQKLSADMHESITSFRDQLVGRPYSERKQAWTQFKPEYQKMWVERARADLDGIGRLYKWGEPPPETPPAGPAPLAPRAPDGITPEALSTLNAEISDVMRQPEPAPLGQVEAPAAPAAESVSSVAAITSRFDLPLANEDGTPNAANQMHALRIVQKYGGLEAKGYSNIFEIKDAGLVERAFAERQRIKDAQLSLDSRLQPPADVDRRIPAYQHLRDNFFTLSPIEQRTTLDWILNKVMRDPISGLETVYSKGLEGAKPEGMSDVYIDLNGLGGVNDHLGHPAGDAYLQLVGDVLSAEIADLGRVFRTGGDEITSWLPEAMADEVMQRVDARIKDAIITLNIDGQPTGLKGFTVSYGIGPTESLADAALYADKARRFELGERAAKGELPRSITPITEAARQEGGVRVVPPAPEELARLEKQQSVRDLVVNRPIAELPPLLQQPTLDILRTLLDEARAGRKPSLLEVIRAKGGLDISLVRDITGEPKMRADWGPGVFQKKSAMHGWGLDEMIVMLEEEGLISRLEIENPADPGGMRRAVELIREEIAGEKVTSPADDRPAVLPDWYKSIRGMKNKRGQVEQALQQIMAGDDNAAFDIDPSALERAIKVEVFNRLAERALEDGALADATGHPFGFDEFESRMRSAAAEIETASEAELSRIYDRLDALNKNTPEAMPAALVEEYSQLVNRTIERLSEEADRRIVGDAVARAEIAMRDQETAGQVAMNRDLLHEQLISEFKLPEDQADAILELTDARAEAWARMQGRTPEEWYQSRLAGVVSGGEGELQQQLQPVNRALTAEEIDNYARALVRAGEGELRRAVTNESERATRVALLDAAHQLDPRLAEKVARQVSDKLYQEAKGAVSFLEDGRAIIHAFERGDVSTVVHEMGHVFRRELEGADLATIEEWAGVRDGVWKRAQEEKFARGFERYLADGVAPTAKLTAVFAKFKTWLLGIYGQLTGSAIDIQIPDNVRTVFDRLLSDEPPAPAQRSQTPIEGNRDVGPALPPRPASDSRLFQDGGDLPIVPPGGYDQLSGYNDVGQFFADGWANEVRPVLDAMKQAAAAPERRYNLGGFDDETQKMMGRYLGQVRSQMASTKHAAIRFGETNRDAALLSYPRQYGFDKIFQGAVPYEFYATRSGFNWGMRVMDRPAFLSQLYRMYQAHNTYQSQMPERMKNKIFIPMPYLPEWMGGGMWIDPSMQLLPMTQFKQPLDAYMRDASNLDRSATYILQEWAQDGTMTSDQAQTALQSRSGSTWDRALEEARLRQEGEGNTGFDYFSMMFSPALYLSLPYYLGTGKPLGSMGFPNGQLPVTRVGQAMETAFKGTSLEWIGNAAGMMAKPEQWLREQQGLSEFGEWGDFYIERQMVNLATEGYAPKDVYRALIEKQGPIYDEAKERVRQELMLRVPMMAPLYGLAHGASFDKLVGSLIPSLFPGGILPPAEMEYKGLKNEYNRAWDAYKAGDKDAFQEFFDAHPEYETRLALRKDPAERLQQFLKSEIWDAYGALGPTDKKQVRAYMGAAFDDFLGSEPGVEFSAEQLATWARMLKASVPVTPETQPALNAPVQDIPLYAPGVSAVTDDFFRARTEKFPNYYAQQQGYYSLPASKRGAYLLQFPEYAEYRRWRDSWYKNYPELKAILNSDAFQTIDTSTWSPELTQITTLYALTGERLPNGARQMLEQIWVREGMPYGDFKSWLNSLVAPALRNQVVTEQELE